MSDPSVEGDIVERLRERDNVWQDRVGNWLFLMRKADQPASSEAETIMRRTLDGEAADHIAALRARCEALEGALEPFAKIAQHVEHTDKRDGEVVHRQYAEGQFHELRREDFRRARAALSPEAK